MQINERILKLTGTANIPDDLELGHDYDCMITMNVHRGGEMVDRGDGTYDVIYKVKPTGMVGIMNDKGVKMVARVKGSPSTKWRWAVENHGRDYEETMIKMLRFQEQILDYVDKLD